MTIHSYSKVWAMGHRVTATILTPGENIVAQEKIDGSQFSFGMRDGVLHCRSRGQQINLDAPDNLFKPAVETVKALVDELVPGYTYRAEAVCKPKHNTITYGRIPEGGLIVYDIETEAQCQFLEPWSVITETKRLGLECVQYFQDAISSDTAAMTLAILEELLETESELGGKIEGIVIKNYDRLEEASGKVLMGKLVREEFKEMHTKDWKKRNPGPTDIREQIGAMFCTEARFEKAVQHLREQGLLKGGPEDIGPLLKELNTDLLAEGQEAISAELMKWGLRLIVKKAARGFPQWYKKKLIDDRFPTVEVEEETCKV